MPELFCDRVRAALPVTVHPVPQQYFMFLVCTMNPDENELEYDGDLDNELSKRAQSMGHVVRR